MGSTRRFSAYLLLVFTFLCAIIWGALGMFQRSFIYFPQRRSNLNTVMIDLPSRAGPVLVSTRPASGPDALIYFGGNAEDVSLVMPSFSETFPNYAIYLLHYPGYGGSAGSPSEQSIVAAAFDLFDAVHPQHPNVVIIGRSLGTGVAVQVVSARRVSRLVLVTPFASLTDVAAVHFPFLPVRWLLQDKFESFKYAPQVTAPTRMIVAGNDEIVPRATTERLRTRFRPGVVSYSVIPRAGHNTISDFPEYLSLLSDSSDPTTSRARED